MMSSTTTPNRRLRWLLAIFVVLLMAFGAFFLWSAPSASAEEPEETYVTVLWAGTDIQWPAEGQTLVATNGGQTEAVLASDWINSLDLECGVVHQGDVYVEDEATLSLINGGKLYGAGNPFESWPGGQYQSSYSIVFTTPACEEPEIPTTTVTAPIITPAVATCVDGVPGQTQATVRLSSDGQGFWTTETSWDAERVAENVEIPIVGSEQTYYYTAKEGVKLGEELNGGLLVNGWVSFTVVPNAVENICPTQPPVDPPTTQEPPTTDVPPTDVVPAAAVIPKAAPLTELPATGVREDTTRNGGILALVLFVLGGIALVANRLHARRN